jgi:hypothetical protein
MVFFLQIQRRRLHARGQVNEDPAALLRVYEEAGQVPDIWNLTEWSDWLLPAYRERAGQRYRGIKGIVPRDQIITFYECRWFSHYLAAIL